MFERKILKVGFEVGLGSIARSNTVACEVVLDVDFGIGPAILDGGEGLVFTHDGVVVDLDVGHVHEFDPRF